MSNPIYKTMKVFDCQRNPGMPDDVKKAFFDIHRDRCTSNDVCVEWTVETSGINDPGTDYAARYKLVDQWLIDNGAGAGSADRCGETVIIKHWW